MDKQMTISAFSDELAQVRTKKKEFLAQIERIVPWKEWIAMIHRINGRIQIGRHAFCENQQDALCICSQGRTDSSCQAGPVSQNQIR